MINSHRPPIAKQTFSCLSYSCVRSNPSRKERPCVPLGAWCADVVSGKPAMWSLLFLLALKWHSELLRHWGSSKQHLYSIECRLFVQCVQYCGMCVCVCVCATCGWDVCESMRLCAFSLTRSGIGRLTVPRAPGLWADSRKCFHLSINTAPRGLRATEILSNVLSHSNRLETEVSGS